MYGPSGMTMLTDWQSNEIGTGWSTNFEQAVPGYNQLLFATGDQAVWFITTEEAVGGTLFNPPQWYNGEKRTILKSSVSNDTYTAIWYNRSPPSTFPEDPWLSVLDHGPSLEIVYGENSFEGSYASILNAHNGANVFVRNSVAPAAGASTCADCEAGKSSGAGSTYCT